MIRHNDARSATVRRPGSGKFALMTSKQDHWEVIKNINLDEAKNCIRAQIKSIKGLGCIVNVANTAGQYGLPNYSPFVYSKLGAIGLTPLHRE